MTTMRDRLVRDWTLLAWSAVWGAVLGVGVLWLEPTIGAGIVGVGVGVSAYFVGYREAKRERDAALTRAKAAEGEAMHERDRARGFEERLQRYDADADAAAELERERERECDLEEAAAHFKQLETVLVSKGGIDALRKEALAATWVLAMKWMRDEPRNEMKMIADVSIALETFGAECLAKRAVEAGMGADVADDIRAMGWSVAVHNDYRQAGERFTFWLFTRGDRAVKGEGRTDADALNQVRAILK